MAIKITMSISSISYVGLPLGNSGSNMYSSVSDSAPPIRFKGVGIRGGGGLGGL